MAKKKPVWFDVPDSLTVEEQGNQEIEYYNIEACFADQKVLDLKASEEARVNCYMLTPMMRLRIKRAALGQPAVKNETPFVLRFYKGRTLPRVDFEACMTAIKRCWQAWEAYQAFRKAPVTEEEKIAIDLIMRGPRLPIARKLEAPRSIVIEDDDEGGEPEAEMTHGEYLAARAAVGAGPEAGSSGGNRAPASDAPANEPAAGRPARPAKAAPKKPAAKKRAA